MKKLPNSKLLFYDGECGFCVEWVYALIKCDVSHRIRFSPRKGQAFNSWVIQHEELRHIDSLIVETRNFDGTETVLVKSAAVRVLIVGMPEYKALRFLLFVTPTWLANVGYDIVAKLRGTIFRSSGRTATHLEGQLGYIG